VLFFALATGFDLAFDFEDGVAAVVAGVLAVAGVGAAAVPPAPESWTTWTLPDGLELSLVRPMSTPTPIASRRTPTPRIRLALDDAQPNRLARARAGMTGALATVPGSAYRALPRRSPHSTQ
jgi:hypothetical protein